ELLTTNHAYNACKNTLEFVAGRAGARVTVATVPFPIASADDVVAAVMAKVTPRTRLATLDHVTSPTGGVMPLGRLTKELTARNVEGLIAGARAPGMLRSIFGRSAQPTTAATATSGSVRRRDRRSSGFAATGAPTCARSRSATARMRSGRSG